MPNLREALAGTAYASLEWCPDWERAVDRVAASGRVDRIGLAIWKARYLLEPSAFYEVRKHFLIKCRLRYKREDAQVVAGIVNQALQEYIAPFCPTCKGAREMVIEQKRILCHACLGSGLRKYTDEDRARGIQCSYAKAKAVSLKVNWILSELGGMDRDVNAIMVQELEREGIDINTRSASMRAEVAAPPEAPPSHR